MEKSTILISLTLFTLLFGVAVAAYQLWAADRAQKRGSHSAMTGRYAENSRPEATAPDKNAAQANLNSGEVAGDPTIRTPIMEHVAMTSEQEPSSARLAEAADRPFNGAGR